MDRVPGPKELRGAAAVATSLAYVVGLAGVVAGGLVFRDGDTTLAFILWVLTFAAGGALMVVALVVRAFASLLGRFAAVEQDLRVLLGDRARGDAGPDRPGDRNWGHQPPW